jgi:hypothetical protein
MLATIRDGLLIVLLVPLALAMAAVVVLVCREQWRSFRRRA